MRRPLQGVWNIIRFNWHFYAFAFLLVFIVILFMPVSNPNLLLVRNMIVLVVMAPIFISLAVSCYVYDLSSLYTLRWLDDFPGPETKRIINIHAGFDETSHLLKGKFPGSELVVLDFYDPEKHTEVSIRRARAAYPPFPDTLRVNTGGLPLQDGLANKVFVIFSAHEIRDHMERITFFREISRILAPSGEVIVTEHLRDAANFLAYNVGFFHFYSRKTWLRTFGEAGLILTSERKLTPFITTFILKKIGNPS